MSKKELTAKEVFICTAERFAFNSPNPLGVFTRFAQAKKHADQYVEDRGGKYSVYVHRCIVDRLFNGNDIELVYHKVGFMLDPKS